jgi:hypothetical protein
MKPNPRKEQLKNYARFSGVAIQMGAIITGGALLGSWLDDNYNPKGKAFTLSLTLFSVVVAMYLVIKEVVNISKKQDEPED